MRSAWLGAGVVLAGALSACSEPGTMEITLDAVPQVVKETSIHITGSILRVPAKNIDFFVTVTGAGAPAGDTIRGDRFDILVTLKLNQANRMTITATDAKGSTGAPANAVVVHDAQGPTVTVNQAANQPDPSNAPPVVFAVVFNEVVSGFDATDVSLAGSTATGSLAAAVTGSGSNYTVTVSGMTGNGNVVASVPAGAATDEVGNTSVASTSADNVVLFALPGPPPTVTINQDAAQLDPTGGVPIRFSAVFSAAVTGFSGADVSLAGSTTGGTLVAAVTGSGTSYTVNVTGMAGPGTVTASIPAGAAVEIGGTPSLASSSSDNVVSFDNVPPALAQATPLDTTDNVSLGTTVQLTFSEPVVLAAGGGILLTRQGVPVSGVTTRSADSLTLTFAPTATLSPNAIYRLGVSGVSDRVNNLVPTNAGTCFVTTPVGATVTQSFNDSPGDTIYQSSGADPNLLPPDLVSARFAREGALLSGIFRFVGPRVFSSTALNQAGVILELDTDEDSLTGYRTIKDTLFFNSQSLGVSYSSGTKSEYIIDLEPTVEVNGDAFVGRKESAFGAFIDASFTPGVCGAQMGFVLPFSFIGDDDGKMHAVIMSIAATTTSLKVDPMPTRGHIALDLRPPSPVPPAVAGAEYAAPASAPGVHQVPPRRRVPLR